MKIRSLLMALAATFVLLASPSAPASAQSIVGTVAESTCAIPDGDGSIVSCQAECPKGRWAVSGHCSVWDSRGQAIAISNFGASNDGQSWKCEFMDTRRIGVVNKPKLDPGTKLQAKAICLNR